MNLNKRAHLAHILIFYDIGPRFEVCNLTYRLGERVREREGGREAFTFTCGLLQLLQ